MSTWLKVWTPDDVQNAKNGTEKAKAYAGYCQQRLGVPYPTGRDFVIMRAKAKHIFASYPGADWKTLCKIADYCKARKKRVPRAWMVLDKYREAWAAGFAPELDFKYVPPDPELENEIAGALQGEIHPWWRRRMIMAQGPNAQRKVLLEWREDKQTSLPAPSKIVC